MFKVEWTNEAEKDLEIVLTYYLEVAGLRVASAIYIRIQEQVGSLMFFPHRCRPGRVAGTKKCVLHRLPYIAVAHVGNDIVTVLNFIHKARRYPPRRKEMNDTVENSVLEHLKRFPAGQDHIERKIEEMTRRLSNLEAGQSIYHSALGSLSIGRCTATIGLRWV